MVGHAFWRDVAKDWLKISLAFGIVLGVSGFFAGGIRAGRLSVRRYPGFSLMRSLLNSFLFSLAGLVGVGLIVSGCHFVFHEQGAFDSRYRVLAGCIGAILFGVLNGPMAIRTFVLRAVLAIEGTLPFRLVRVLNQAVKLVLLRRITSGFFFIHKTQLDYFAMITDEEFEELFKSIG
jgi:hypothetical protein